MVLIKHQLPSSALGYELVLALRLELRAGKLEARPTRRDQSPRTWKEVGVSLSQGRIDKDKLKDLHGTWSRLQVVRLDSR